MILHGYEFRALVRLARNEGGFSYKVTDLREYLKGKTTTPLDPEQYIQLPEEYRIFE